ncbi:MAG: glycosyltransferase family 4 protein [Commensalibacter sp.]
MTHFSSGVMTVLPPKEGFSPESVGAIGLLIKNLAEPGDRIVGKPLNFLPFSGIQYSSVSRSFWPFSHNRNYACGVIDLIKHYQPKMVEVHNRPELAIYLAKKCPSIVISLFLHNDPLTMREAKTVQQRLLLMEKAHVVVVSDWLKQRFLEGLTLDQVCVLPNCINFQQLPNFVPLEDRQKRILFVGRLVADKGADLFVQACGEVLKYFPDWKAEMIGADRFSENSPETAFIKNLKKQAKANQIRLRGYMSHSRVLSAMMQSSIAIMPSRWPEPFGMTALEAMACGTPLIVSNRGALPSVVGDAAIQVDLEQPFHLVNALKKLIKNKNICLNQSHKGLQQAKKYDLQKAKEALRHFRLKICPILKDF